MTQLESINEILSNDSARKHKWNFQKPVIALVWTCKKKEHRRYPMRQRENSLSSAKRTSGQNKMARTIRENIVKQMNGTDPNNRDNAWHKGYMKRRPLLVGTNVIRWWGNCLIKKTVVEIKTMLKIAIGNIGYCAITKPTFLNKSALFEHQQTFEPYIVKRILTSWDFGGTANSTKEFW